MKRILISALLILLVIGSAYGQSYVNRSLNTIYQTGTGGNDLVQLDSSGRLPAVDGSQLTNLPGASMTYPGAGIAVSSGSAWGSSLTAPASDLVGISDNQTLTNKTLTAPVANL